MHPAPALRSVLSLASALFAGAAALTAQQTWIVDPTGTGHFTNLGAAIPAAAAGDTLLLRGGVDDGSYVLDRRLHVVGETPQPRLPVPRVGELRVQPAAAGSTLAGVMLRALRVDAPVSVEACVIAACSVSAQTSFADCMLGGTTDPFGSPNLLAGVSIAGGDVVLTTCLVRGGAPSAMVPQCAPLRGLSPVYLNSGSVAIADSVLLGDTGGTVPCGNTLVAVGGGPAMFLASGTARVTRSVLVSGSAPALSAAVEIVPQSPPAVLEADASTTFVPPFAGATTVFLPVTTGDGGAPGRSILCAVESLPNLPAVLVAGLGMRAPTALPQGVAWVDPMAAAALAIGATDPVGRLAASIALPPSLRRGPALTAQGVVLQSGTVTLATPVVLHVR